MDRSAPPKREKFLNVIYFVDGSKTYNLKVSLRSVMICLGVATAVVLWSLSSIVFLTKSRVEIAGLKKEYAKSLAKIFDYQISAERVYDQAYQKETPKQPAPAVEIKKPIEAQPVVAATKAEPAKPNEDTSEGDTAEKPIDHSLKIIASNPRFKAEAGMISFAFDLKNENSHGQSEGFVWVVAEVQLANGAVTKLVAPGSVSLDSAGDIKNHKQAYRFSIKRFREREFKLKDPKDAVELKKATVFVTDLKRAHIDKFEFPTSFKLRESPKTGAVRILPMRRQLARQR